MTTEQTTMWKSGGHRRRLTLEQLEDRTLLAAPTLLKDINEGPGDSLPSNGSGYSFTDVDGTTCFSADDGNRSGVWKTNGEPNGTEPFQPDLSTGALTEGNGTLFFLVDVPNRRRQLWTSDGTPGGTGPVTDVDGTFEFAATTHSLSVYEGSVYFNPFNFAGGPQRFGVWRADGTGAEKIGDGYQLVDAGEFLLFANPFGLYRSNGEPITIDNQPTFLGPDIRSVGSCGVGALNFNSIFVGGALYFEGQGDTSCSLWKTDGTEESVSKVLDLSTLEQAPINSDILEMTVVGESIYFTSSVGVDVEDLLWEFDTNTGETTFVRAFQEIQWLTEFNDELYFSANSGESGSFWGLWKSDGTDVGTLRVKDGGRPLWLTVFDRELYYTDSNPPVNFFQTLWQSDGTEEGTKIVDGFEGADIRVNRIDKAGTNLYLTARDSAHGTEPWVSLGAPPEDFGDAPESYGTLFRDDGPRHKVVDGVFLGSGVDKDSDGHPHVAALGDDYDGDDDEDGVRFVTPLVPGEQAMVSVKSRVNGTSGFLWGWMDFNGNGRFEDPEEKIFSRTSLLNTEQELTFDVPADATEFDYARFRFTSDSSVDLGPTGPATDGSIPDGEVEDYSLRIIVNSTGDDDDLNPGDGACDTGNTIRRLSNGTTSDEPECTIRAAITEANEQARRNEVTFDIPTMDPGHEPITGGFTVFPGTDLPTVTVPIGLDATTQPGYVGRPLIELDGLTDVDASGGIHVTAGSTHVRGFAIKGFSNGPGILVETKGGNVLEKNYVGTSDIPGTVSNKVGISIVDAAENRIRENLISGNEEVGVKISGSASKDNIIEANHIGFDVGLNVPLGNGSHGVEISNASENTVGGQNVDARNVISASGGHGVYIHGQQSTLNQVLGNYIGTTRAGTRSETFEFGNDGYGVDIQDSSKNRVGGLTSIGADGNPTPGTAPGNVISHNLLGGVRISGAFASENLIRGNLIGTDASGNRPLLNTGHGVELVDAPKNTIGGTVASARNVISANLHDGVHIVRADESVIQGNYIGTNILGIRGGVDLGNSGHGVSIRDARGVSVGGSVGFKTNGDPAVGMAPGNVLSDNGFSGVAVTGSRAVQNMIQGNLNVKGTNDRSMGNGFRGIEFRSGASDNSVGGSIEHSNVIAFNGDAFKQQGYGVMVDSGTGNRIQHNSIYSNAGRAIDLGNDSFTMNDVEALKIGNETLAEFDGDPGANNLQNFPEVTAVKFQGMSKVVTWTLNSVAEAEFEVEFYANASPNPSGFGDLQRFVGSETVQTNVEGTAIISKTFKMTDTFLSATATDMDGNTSEASIVDTDADAIADRWETRGIDVDEDGVIDVNLPLADPMHKDIFIELDWMASRTPTFGFIRALKAAFARAPATAGGSDNPDGSPGINLWIDPGGLTEGGVLVGDDLGGGNLLPTKRLGGLDGDFYDLKRVHFDDDKRSFVFRYSILAEPAADAPGGQAELGGNDFVVFNARTRSSVATYMHELGHSLNLRHGGFENHNCKPNYVSVMNSILLLASRRWDDVG